MPALPPVEGAPPVPPLPPTPPPVSQAAPEAVLMHACVPQFSITIELWPSDAQRATLLPEQKVLSGVQVEATVTQVPAIHCLLPVQSAADKHSTQKPRVMSHSSPLKQLVGDEQLMGLWHD
jgi:hypothetical protein